MSSFTVSKSILIKAPLEKVYAAVAEFRQWPKWSPWLICDPACRVNFAEDGRKYHWDGPVAGTGTMTVLAKVPQRTIRYRLMMMKPVNSISEVAFDVRAKDKETEVIWNMEGSLPIFLFFVKGTMKAAIGMDYTRGLAMLKDYVETGSVPSKLEFPSQASVAAFRYAGIRTKSAISELGPKMEECFEKLRTWHKEQNIKPSGKAFSIYHRWDPVRGKAEFTCGYPLAPDAATPQLPSGAVVADYPACSAEVIRHTGPYRHVGNAWAAGMARTRAKVFQQSKDVDPFEIYENEPKETPPEKLVTAVHFPVR